MMEIVIAAKTPATLGAQKREWGAPPALGGVGGIQRLPEGNTVHLQSCKRKGRYIPSRGIYMVAQSINCAKMSTNCPYF